MTKSIIDGQVSDRCTMQFLWWQLRFQVCSRATKFRAWKHFEWGDFYSGKSWNKYNFCVSYVDCGIIIDKALVFSKGHLPPKSLLYFLESSCKNLEIVLKVQDSKCGIYLPDFYIILHVNNFKLFSKTTNAGNVHKIKCNLIMSQLLISRNIS